MGLISQAQAKPFDVKKIEAAIRAKVPAKDKDAFDRIMIAGLKMMFDPQVAKTGLAQIQGDDKPEDIGKATFGLLMLLYQRSRKTMPMQVGGQAGVALCAHALEFAAKAGVGVQADNETNARVVKAYSGYFLQKLGATPEKIQQMKQQQAGV